MDSRMMCRAVINSCQSAATSEIVNRCWPWVWLEKAVLWQNFCVFITQSNQTIMSHVQRQQQYSLRD